MSEFIEIISPNAKQQITDIMAQVDLLANKIKSIPNFQLSNTPSGADDAIKKLTADLALQAKEIDNLKTKLAGLNQERQKSVKLTTQQKVDNAIILKEEKQLVTLTSAYADAYVKLNAQRTIAKTKLQDLIASERASNKELREAQKEFDKYNKKVAAADKAVGKFSEANSKINGLSRSVGNLMTAFGVSTGLYLFASIAKDIYQVTKQLQSLDLALKMVSGSQEEFANNQSFLTNLAEQYGIEIKGLTKNFTEFWVASKGKLEAEQIKAIFTSISKSVAVMGLSVEQQDSAFLALQQMMSKGTVQAEELKKQLGNALPGAVKAATMAYQALHPELKVTEKYFMEQMKAGKVLSAELLPELAKAYEKLYGIENVKRAETLQAAQERLQNSWTELVRSMNESKTGGISLFFKAIIDGATSAMESIGWLNDDWDELFKKAKGEGKAKGESAFEKEFMKNVNVKSKNGKFISYNEIGKDGGKEFLENVKGQLTEEQITLKVLNESRQKHIELKEEELKLRNEWQRLVDEGNDPVGTKRKLERLYKEIATIETVIGIARQKAGLDKASAKPKPSGTSDTKSKIDAENKALKDSMKVESVGGVSLSKEEDTALEKLELLKKALEKTRDETAKNAVEFAQFEKSIKGVNDAIDVITKPLTTDITAELEAKVKPYNDAKKSKLEQDREDLEAIRRTFNEFAGGFSEKLGFGETFDFFGQQDENGKTYFGKLLEAEDKTKAYFLAISTAAQDAFNIISEASQRNFEQEYERLEKQKETALKFAGESDAAKQKIEEDYAKRRRIIEKREFKAKQQQAIVNIAIDTAQAVMAVNAKAQWWMTPVMIALGIAQTAMVASQKYKEYWKGTDNAEAGLAWTQERGAEIVLDKHDRIKSFGSDSGAQLTMMEGGETVIDAKKSKKIMFDNGLNSILSNNGIKEAKIEIVNKGLTVDEMDMVIGKHFANIQTNHTSFDQRGIQQWSEKNGNRTIRNANRGSGIGFRV